MQLHFKKREDGSSLFVAMTICLVVGLILSGYLVLTSNRFQMTVRSSDWNAAIPVLEAGVEEALTHLKNDTTPTANNWTADTVAGYPVYTKKRTFSDGSYFYVYIRDYSSGKPTIYSQGFVRSPYKTTPYIARLVKVGATNAPSVFTRAIAVNGQVTMVGNAMVDGFDSRVGGYRISTNRSAQGGIATNSKNTGAISVGGGSIYGPVSVGAGGTVQVGAGAVGDVAWVSSHSGIQPGWVDTTMNVAFPSNAPPSGGPYLAPAYMTNVTSGIYQMSSYSGSMTINGNVTLYITGNFTMSGGNVITIKPGASFKLIAGGSVSMGGGGVLNNTGLASNFSIIGLNSCGSITYNGNAVFIGTVNAPQADFILKGNAEGYGAVIANSASMNGITAFHYDAALPYSNGYIVSSWQEL